MLRCCVLIGVVLTQSALAGDESMRLAEGKFGKALDVRATPLQVDANPRYRVTPLTVECWAKLFSKSENVLIACDPRASRDHWELGTKANTGRLYVRFGGALPSSVTSQVDVCDQRWHHIAMTNDGKSVALFVDGKEVARSKVVLAKSKPAPGPLTIGMTLLGIKSIRCDGLIDEVRLTGGIRTFGKVPTEAPELDRPTIGLWRFDSVDEVVVDPAWTPRPIEGDVPAWWKETDKDWVDARLQQMDTGPFFNATFAYMHQGKRQLAYKGTAIRIGDKGEASVLFDRALLRFAAAWTGGYLKHSTRRFGLLNTPQPAGPLVFSTPTLPGCRAPNGRRRIPSPSATIPLPRRWGHYRGLYLHGNRVALEYTVGNAVVRESPWVEHHDGMTAITRSLEVGPGKNGVRLLAAQFPATVHLTLRPKASYVSAKDKDQLLVVGMRANRKVNFGFDEKKTSFVSVPGNRTGSTKLKLFFWRGPKQDLPKFFALVEQSPAPQSLDKFLQPGPPRWGTSISVEGKLGKDDSAYVVDTIPVPFDNRYKALMFLSGVDFVKNDIMVSSAHGDVWRVQGADADLKRVTWQRFATGMYQPLGLKVVAGKVYVLERGQLTRLHDRNGDGEADFYENFNHDWHTGSGQHSFDTCLEADPEGNFYFFKTGDTSLPHGGCLMRVAHDGSSAEVFSTGYRHPIGLSVSPDGVVTGADQEGNWMPSTRVDIYKRGGFYGDMRSHHRKTPPAIYDAPLCWLPRQLDNSAGGQVWVPPGRFGPLGGKLLHLSYGNCRGILLLRQTVDGTLQAGGIDLGLEFLSGVMRGRFRDDGLLYVVGMEGWQTAAAQDGCLQRVRYTGKEVLLPTGLTVHANGIHLTFATPLDASASDKSRYRVRQWNYRWSGDYGSKRWSAKHPDRIGEDVLTIESVRLLPDGRSVFLEFANVRPVMQMHIGYDLSAKSGKKLQGDIYNTIHKPAPKFEPKR